MGYNDKLAYNGREMTLKEWASETGFCYETLYARKRRGLTPEQILSMEGPRRCPRIKRSETELAAFRAQEQIGRVCASPVECLKAAILCRAILDYFEPAHRAEVEQFFRGEWFAALTDLDGERVLELVKGA